MNHDTSPLEEAKGVLDDLESDLKKQRAFWSQIEIDNPGFDPVSQEHWEKKHARSWMHGGTDLRETNELERWLYDKPPITKTAQLSAQLVHKQWRNSLKPEGPDSMGAYYSDDQRFKIPSAHKNETLIDFVIRLATLVEDHGKGHPLQWRATNSFIDFLRKTYPDEEVAFVEQIFPLKKDVQFGRIIRLIQPEAYPIPQVTAAELLIELARICMTDRMDVQLTAAESLGLCWMCLTASRLRLPIYLKILYKTKVSALQFGSGKPTLLVPTCFGDRSIIISRRVAEYLDALSRIPSKEPRETIFQRPLRSLTRMLAEAVENIAPRPEYGNITFVSLLSHPHHFGNHRPQPK